MSLYRHHQRLARMVDLADYARFMLPVAAVMDVVGILDIGPNAVGHILALVGAAAVSVIGAKWHRRARAVLTMFELQINRSPSLSAKYWVDAEAGQVADMRGELAVSLTAAAVEARRGHTTTAGLLYANAKVIESRLRERGC